MDHKILIIENQWSQFDQIRQNLRGPFDIYPKTVKEYNEITSWACIYLNDNYPYQRTQDCFKKLKEYIRSRHIDLFIIDYMLVATYGKQSGIYLAVSLVSDKFTGKPVIFLSATPMSPKIEEALNPVREHTNCVWVEKGWAGISLEEGPYIENYLAKNIIRLLVENEQELNSKKVKKLSKDPQFGEYTHELKEIIQKLEAGGKLTDLEDEHINWFTDQDEDVISIDEIINRFKIIKDGN